MTMVKQINILLLGNKQVGKSSLISNLMGIDQPNKYIPNTGLSIHPIGNLNFIDTPGSSEGKWGSLTKEFINNIDIILIIIEKKSISKFIKEKIKEVRTIKKIPKIYIKNKTDINGNIEGMFNISIKNDTGIEELHQYLMEFSKL